MIECWPDTDLLVLVCQMPAIAIVVVVGLHLLPSLSKKVLDTPLGCQVVVVTWILCDLDLPLPGGHCCSKLCPRPCAQLESQLVAASWGLHIHWWKKDIFCSTKISTIFLLTVLPWVGTADAWGCKPSGVSNTELVYQALALVGEEDCASVLHTGKLILPLGTTT